MYCCHCTDSNGKGGDGKVCVAVVNPLMAASPAATNIRITASLF